MAAGIWGWWRCLLTWDRQVDLKRESGRVSHDVLRRMVSPPPPSPEDVPITSSRAMRLAITRAADKTHNLIMNVGGLREETLSLEDMLAAQSPDHMLVAAIKDDEVIGLAALDVQLRSALIEVQTVGKILGIPPEDRPPTNTDASMAEPLLAAILQHMGDTTLRTPLEGWGQGVVLSGQIPSVRSAGLVLPDITYRVIRMSLDLAVADRQGELVFALPDAKGPDVTQSTPVETEDWATRFHRTVNASAVRLDAQLHRFKLPLHIAQSLEVGQVLPLRGCQVSSLKLLARDGRMVATARLGQSAGMRAIRIEAATAPDMEDLDQMGQGTLPAPQKQAMFGSPDGGMAQSEDMDFDMAADGSEEFDMAMMSDDGDDETPLSWDDQEQDMSEEQDMSTISTRDWSEEAFDASQD